MRSIIYVDIYGAQKSELIEHLQQSLACLGIGTVTRNLPVKLWSFSSGSYSSLRESFNHLPSAYGYPYFNMVINSFLTEEYLSLEAANEAKRLYPTVVVVRKSSVLATKEIYLKFAQTHLTQVERMLLMEYAEEVDKRIAEPDLVVFVKPNKNNSSLEQLNMDKIQEEYFSELAIGNKCKLDNINEIDGVVVSILDEIQKTYLTSSTRFPPEGANVGLGEGEEGTGEGVVPINGVTGVEVVDVSPILADRVVGASSIGVSTTGAEFTEMRKEIRDLRRKLNALIQMMDVESHIGKYEHSPVVQDVFMGTNDETVEN